MTRKTIEILGARENNLKNVDIEIPRDQLTVITGVSGSGKSSLAFDTLFAESHRRFLESLSAWARSRLPTLKRPDVSLISGLSPVVSIQQKKGIKNPRSSVASLTDIGSYLRLLYAITGTAHCPYCEREISIKTSPQIAEHILSLPSGTTVEIRAPVHKVYGETYQYILDLIRNRGYRTFRLNGELFDTSTNIVLDENEVYIIEAIIDKFILNGGMYKNVVESLEAGFLLGQKFIRIEILNPDTLNGGEIGFYENFACPEHHIITGELLPWYFSANDLETACQTCLGIGTYKRTEPFLLIADENKSLRGGAFTKQAFNMETKTFKRMNNERYMLVYSLGQHYGFSLDIPYKELSTKAKEVLLYGTAGEKFEFMAPPDHNVRKHPHVGKMRTYEGVVNQINRWYKQYASRKQIPDSIEEMIVNKVMVDQTCPDCGGVRLKQSRSLIRINGLNIHQTSTLSLKDLVTFLSHIKFPPEKTEVGKPVLGELKKRVGLLVDIGLGYLTLARRSNTLSGGEIQRTILSTQIGSDLMGMLYVLDEPSIGLHQRDGQRLIRMLKVLRDLGNTVVVVEHDTEMMEAADHIIELGPGPGTRGGEIVFEGNISAIKDFPESLTGRYLAGLQKIEVPHHRRLSNGQTIRIIGARENNLKNIDVKIPLGIFVTITGVSGSGKSSLVKEILYKRLHQALRDRRIIPGSHDRIEGIAHIKDIRNMDQSPIGASSRSNPATYVGIFNKIRRLFADLPEAVNRGYTYQQFSFNSRRGGRCLTCQGEGIIRTKLQYMPDVESKCPECKGARFTPEILEIKYRHKSIADVLDLTVEEGIDFFKDVRLIHHKLKTLNALGLGYLKLGQPSNTLSGGEAQRIKLATELGKIKRSHGNLYILDEPTTGLHLDDIKKLLQCLNKLVDAGNSVIVIEHHLDVIKTADYVIDLGPDGGETGGYVVAKGTPEQVARVGESFTGQYLKSYLNGSSTPHSTTCDAS